MLRVQDIADRLASFAPPVLAEEWDNVGLLVGDTNRSVQRVMTCLTLTAAPANEAVERRADLVVTHHPLPFRALKRLTNETPEGRVLLRLIAAGVAIYSPHTALDSAYAGINQQLAIGLKLEEICPLVVTPECPGGDLGSGRIGIARPPTSLRELAEVTKSYLTIPSVRVVGGDADQLTRVAVACGSGGSFLTAASEAGCDALVTGEATFHTCLAAEAAGIGMILTGHYASERFALDTLAEYLSEQFADLEVWASRDEQNPIRVV